MKIKKISVALLICYLLTSCITASITSNKSPDFNDKLEKVFITMRGAPNSKSFFRALQNNISIQFKLRGIESRFHIFDELSLKTEEELIKEVSRFAPQVLMTINQTERRTTTGTINSSPGATFDIKIIQPNSKTIAWRGSLKTDTFSELSEGADLATKKLIEKLTLDGLITTPIE